MAGNAALYDEDFYAWSTEQARLLRAGEFARLDIANIAEELESMGRSDKRQIESRLVVLLAYLLKWQVQVGFRSQSRSATIRVSVTCRRSRRVLRPLIGSVRPALYARARRAAADETWSRRNRLPGRLPIHRRAGPGRGFSAGGLSS
jgi:hypothetical protein